MVEFPSCVFCGSQPTTVEDVVPNWLRRCWKVSRQARIVQGLGYADRVEFRKPKRVQQVRLQVKALCGTCNNVRFGQLENEVKPILEPIARNWSWTGSLPPTAKTALGVWAFKTAIMHEFAAGYRPTERLWRPLLSYIELPRSASVFMVSIGDRKFRAWRRSLVRSGSVLADDEVDGFYAAFTFVTFGLAVAATPTAVQQLRAPLPVGIQLWPVELTTSPWPPPKSYTADEFDDARQALLDALPSVRPPSPGR